MTFGATSSNDLEVLALAARGGDRGALTELLAALQPRLIRYCRAKIGSRYNGYSSADDVAQEVLLAALTALPTYRPTGPGFAAFVFGIAAHKIADYYRYSQRDVTTPVGAVPDFPHDNGNPEAAALRAEQQRKVRELLGTLSPRQREILIHRIVNELSSEETAGLLGTTPSAIRVAQHRALEKLRRELKG